MAEEAAPTGTAAPAADPAKPAAVEKPATLKDSFAAVKEKARTGGGAAPAKPAAAAPAAPAAKAAVDPDLAAAERILQEDARVKAEDKRVRAEAARIAADRTQFEAERAAGRARDAAVAAARAKGDPVEILKANGFTTADIYEGDDSLLVKLAEMRTKKPELDAKAQLAQVIDEKLAEKDAEKKAADDEKAKADEAEEKKKQDAANASLEEAKESFSANVIDIVEKSPEKYPTLVRLKVKAGVVTNYALQTMINSEGKIELSEADALADIEAHYAAEARRALGVEEEKKETPTEEKKPEHRGISINPSWSREDGSPAAKPKPAAGGTLKDKFEGVKQKAREAAAKK